MAKQGNVTVVDFSAGKVEPAAEVEVKAVNGTVGEGAVDGTGLKGDKKTLAVAVSSKFEEAVSKWASTNDKSVAQVIRLALAQFVGYDLSAEPVVTRGTRMKYANKDEAAAAQKAKVAERNALIKQLLAEYRAKENAK